MAQTFRRNDKIPPPDEPLHGLDSRIECFVAPPLCPLMGSPADFSLTSALIERAAESTRTWLAEGGLDRRENPAANACAQTQSVSQVVEARLRVDQLSAQLRGWRSSSPRAPTETIDHAD